MDAVVLPLLPLVRFCLPVFDNRSLGCCELHLSFCMHFQGLHRHGNRFCERRMHLIVLSLDQTTLCLDQALDLLQTTDL